MKLRRTIHTGLNWLGSRRDARGGVLLYHRVDEPTLDPFNLCVSPSHFEDQLALIADSGQALSLHDFMERKRSGKLDRGALCLTFDDGYLDVYTKALPLLEKYEVPATVFVTTGNLGEAFWWDRLASMVFGARALPENLLIEPAQSSPFEISSLSRKGTYDLLYPILRSASPPRRELIFQTLTSQLEISSDIKSQRCLNEDEIRQASSHPLLTIGAHTVTHSLLCSLDHESQRQEIERSKQTLEQITGKRVDTLSYPFGLYGRDFDETTIQAAADSGIRYAFAADRNAVTAQTNELSIPRLWVHNQSVQAVRRPMHLWTGNDLQRSVGLSS